MTKGTIINISLGIILVVGLFIALQDKSETSEPVKTNEVATKVNDPKPDQEPTPSIIPTEKASITYTNYNEESLANANPNGQIVIFFHAGWCPTCKGADRDITENISELPSNLTILKADYDTETELKKKYNIVTQHTFVQIDANGNEITKWIGGGVATINDNLKES